MSVDTWASLGLRSRRLALPRRRLPGLVHLALAILVALIPFMVGPTDGAQAAATSQTLLVGMGGGASTVAAFNGAASPPSADGVWQPYGSSFTGGSQVALGDVNGDGTPDAIAAAGPGGGAIVRVYDGTTLGGSNPTQIQSFFAFESFTGGVSVAAGDVDGDGSADIVVGTDTGDARVRVVRGGTSAELRDFTAFSGFTGGVRVAAGDVNGDGLADVVAGAGSGAESRVKVFSGSSNDEIRSFVAFSGFTGGVHVAAGDVNGDGSADIVAGTGSGGLPQVKVFNGQSGAVLRDFLAFDQAFTGGVRVGAGDVNGDGSADLVVGTGPGGAQIKVFSGSTNTEIRSFLPFSGFTGGVFVAGVPMEAPDPEPIATQLEFSTEPGGAHFNQPLNPQPVVRALDASGDLVPSFTGQITLTFDNSPQGAALNGTTTVTAVNGVATFTNISISAVYNAYRLKAASGSLTTAISTTFAITEPPPTGSTQLVFAALPNDARPGQPFQQQPSVVALKANGQVDSTFTGAVALSIGTNPSGGALSGTTTVNAQGGLAIFSGLSIDKAGVGYTLVASSGTLQSATSAPFQVDRVSCTPRQRIEMTVAADGPGRLKVTLKAPQGAGNEDNRLRRVQFFAANNGSIDLPASTGQPARNGLTGSPGPATVTLTERPATLTFWVQRDTVGQATTVKLVVADGCNDWNTFVGGGPSAF